MIWVNLINLLKKRILNQADRPKQARQEAEDRKRVEELKWCAIHYQDVNGLLASHWQTLSLCLKYDLTELLDRVYFLRFFYLPLSALPPGMGKLTNLFELEIENFKQLNSLPAEIGALTKLEVMHLRWNALQSLPPEIGNLTCVYRIFLHGNQFRILPAEIGKMAALRFLMLKDNRLEALPEEIGNLAQLNILDVSSNQLSTLPESIGRLGALTSIKVYHNRLTSLPESVGELKGIKTLNLAITTN